MLKLFKLIRLIRTSDALARRIQQSHLAYVAHPAIIRLFSICCALILSWHVIGAPQCVPIPRHRVCEHTNPMASHSRPIHPCVSCAGCIWWLLRSEDDAKAAARTVAAQMGHADVESVAVNFIPLPSNGSWSALSYIEAYYWAISVTTGIGVPVLPLTHAEAVFDGFITFLGILLQVGAHHRIMRAWVL